MNLWASGSKKEDDNEPVIPDPPLEAGSWEKPRQVLPEPPVGDRRVQGAPIGRMIARDKKRRNHLSVCLSDEEEMILRTHVAALNLNFSEWAREVLFEAAKKKLPSRTRSSAA
jgi:hypothetical protein